MGSSQAAGSIADATNYFYFNSASPASIVSASSIVVATGVILSQGVINVALTVAAVATLVLGFSANKAHPRGDEKWQAEAFYNSWKQDCKALVTTAIDGILTVVEKTVDTFSTVVYTVFYQQ